MSSPHPRQHQQRERQQNYQVPPMQGIGCETVRQLRCPPGGLPVQYLDDRAPFVSPNMGQWAGPPGACLMQYREESAVLIPPAMSSVSSLLPPMQVLDIEDERPNQWRRVTWSKENWKQLRENLISFKPKNEALTKVRILLLGPVGAGKTSFISSIISVMKGRSHYLPGIGSSPDSFTKKLKSYHIRAEREGQPTALTLCDVMGFGDCKGIGLTYKDTLEVIKGHVPEGYKFSNTPIKPEMAQYRASPSVKDKIHCVAFVLDACKVLSYNEHVENRLKSLIRVLSERGIPYVVLLTHVDQVCPAVREDVQYVYTSSILKERVEKAAERLGLPVSSVLPVKNYSSEHSVNCNTDILLLRAVRWIQRAINDACKNYQPRKSASSKSDACTLN